MLLMKQRMKSILYATEEDLSANRNTYLSYHYSDPQMTVYLLHLSISA